MKTLESIYTDFQASDLTAAKKLLDPAKFDPTTDNINAFTELVRLLYPSPPGAFLQGKEFWDKLKEIGSKIKSDSSSQAYIAKNIRVYYATLGVDPGSDTLANEIKSFYTKDGKRPSAYKGYTNRAVDKKNYVDATLRDMLYVPDNLSSTIALASGKKKVSLMYVLIDTPTIDIKMRNADKAEVFLNYMPSIVASQLMPYLDVQFSLTRNLTSSSPERSLDTMSTLRFLLGDPQVPLERGSADAMYYDGSVNRRLRRLKLKDDALKRINQARAQARLPPLPNPTAQESLPSEEVIGKSIASAGMDLFTMPQTLINLDYNQTANPRYNPVINPTVPFGTITSFSMNIAPSVGVMSFKTATMVLKIFDRSRLVEIADFINPKLYQSVTIWVNYGYLAPENSTGSPSGADVQTYFDFINDNMMRREAYGVRNSGMTIENDGTVTVTLSLFTKAAQNVLEAVDSESAAYEKMQQTSGDMIRRLSELGKRLGLQAFADAGKDVRGSALISAALSGNLTEFDSKTLDSEIKAITQILNGKSFKNNDDAGRFVTLLNSVYQISGAASKTSTNAKIKIVEDLDNEAKILFNSRFNSLRNASRVDLFGENLAAVEQKYDQDVPKPSASPLNRILQHKKTSEAAAAAGVKYTKLYGDFGTLSFGRLFGDYFSQVVESAAADDVASEFQVIFYKLNDYAGKVAGINIAEFPIDIMALETAYTKRVSEQKGERMSLDMLLQVVRESQFSDMRHQAYGFRDLYQSDAKTGALVTAPGKEAEVAKRALENDNRGGPFLLPSIDYYIETGYASPDENKKVVRIHVYDKASSPHKAASRIFSHPEGFIEVDDEYLMSQLAGPRRNDVNAMKEVAARIAAAKERIEKAAAAAGNVKDIQTLITKELAEEKSLAGINIDASKAFRVIRFKSNDNKPVTFESVKREISRLVPTITIGSNGTAVSSVSYTTNQDALLSTIMMLRNTNSSANPSKPNGSSDGTLPLRVVPGQLSLTTMGCPIVEYMQQFFVDLGTGTTVDNLYNITGLTHNLTPGKFTTEIKFTFADAYGQYEGPQTLVDGLSSKLQLFRQSLELNAGKK